jgi:L-threonylcarbamoyladenylate synthase
LSENTIYMGFDAPHAQHFQGMPRDPTSYAQQLYATLRRLDMMGYSAIAVQPVPTEAEWAAIADRLKRAAVTFADQPMPQTH